MGYLGKISALVTANTGDFSRNLNAAASDVRRFAGAVQSNITKASSDAERAFKSIYTPLQTLERSLKAASSMKLSFKGFDGAIRDVNVLKERLTSIKGTQVDLILKASGLRTISEFREAIKDISNESFNFAIRFGGIDKLKLIREELRGVSSTSINAVLEAGGIERLKELKETVAGLKGDQLNLALRVGGTETLTKVEQQATGLTRKDMNLLVKVGGAESLDRIVEEVGSVSSRSIDALVNIKGLNEFDAVLENFRNLSPEQIDAVIKVVGAKDLEDAVTRVQQLRSAAILVAEPLGAAAQKFSKLSIDAQAGFVGALSVSQTKVRELQQDIDDGVTIGTTRFKQLEAQVLRTAEAIDRIGEAEALIGQVGNGRTFQFDRPLDREALIKAGESRAAALKLPGQSLADNPEIAALQNRINGLANQYPRLQANLEAAKEAGADYSPQIAAIDKWRAHLLRLIADQEKQIAVSAAQGQSTPLPRFRGERSFIGDRIAAQRAAQEDAMFADRASEVASANAAAARQRRLQRQAFGDAVMEGSRQPSPSLFGGDRTPVVALQSALARTAELDAAYSRLSQTARVSLQRQAAELDGVARAASAGAASVGVLVEANNRMAASIAAVTAATERDAAAERARQALRMRSIVDDDRRITQERAVAEARQLAADEFAESRRSAVSGAAQILSSRASRQDSMETVLSGISGRAQEARVAVANASSARGYDDLRQRLTAVLSELQAVESEERRLSLVDPAREQLDSWEALDGRIRTAYDRLGAITGLARRFRQESDTPLATPESPASPDRNEGNIGTFTSIRSVGLRTDISDMNRRSSLADRRRQIAREALGEDVDAPRRQMAAVLGSAAALKNQISQLSPPLRAEMVPAIREAEQEMLRLAANADTTGDQIEQAAANLRDLEATARRLSAVDAFSKSFGNMDEFLGNAKVKQFAGEMTAIRDILSGAEDSPARRRAVRASDKLAAVKRQQLDLDEAERGGVVFPEQRASLNRRAEVLEAVVDRNAASAAGISRSQARRRRRRGGDVGRMGADNASLALNQIAFAVDDFMSSTGGLEFKLRAISNNITQMAFVLGGTTGLFVGLGAVMAGQVAVGFIKYLNNGRSAEDQTKALNDSLARQKSLVEELAQAFGALGDALARGTLSESASQRKDFATQIEDIRRKQKESREASVADIDPAVQLERAEQNKRQSQLEKETDIGRRIAIQREMAESKRREEAARDAAVARVPSPDEARSRVRTAMIRVGLAALGPRRGDEAGRAAMEQAVRDRAEAATAAIPVGNTPDAIRAQMAAVSQEIQSLSAAGAESSPLGFATSEVASNEIPGLERLLKSLELPLAAAIDELAVSIAEAARGPAETIRRAQEQVASAIEAGIPGARLFGLEADKVGGQLSAAMKKLEIAVAGKDEKGNALDVNEKDRIVKEARDEIAGLESSRSRLEQSSEALRYERIVNPQQQIEARMGRALANLSAAGLDDGRIARRMREIEAEREKIGRDAQMPGNDNAVMQGFFEGREAALNQEVAALEAATIAVKAFAEALDRSSEEVRGNLNSAQQAADEARRNDLANSTPQTQEARRMAEADLERQRELQRQAQTEIAVERDRLAGSPEAQRLRQVEEELKSGADANPQRMAEQRAKIKRELSAAEQESVAADGSVDSLEKYIDSERAFSEAFGRAYDAQQKMGLDGLPFDEANKKLREAGSGDLVDEYETAAARRIEALGNVSVKGVFSKDRLADAQSQLEESRRRQESVAQRQAKAAQDLAAIDAQIAASPTGTREDLILERERLKAKMDDEALANAERIAASRDASTRDAEQAKAAARGRELAKTPEQKFQEETDAGLESIRQYFGRQAEAGGGIVDFAAQRKAEERFLADRDKEARTATAEGRGADLGMTDQERFRRDFAEGPGADIIARARKLDGAEREAFLRQSIRNQMESVAPMVAGFAEERQIALLQGPSRAALNVSDVSTTQGQSELNRLLRGDDSAKDVNLAELRKQTGKLDEVVKTIQQAFPEVLL